MRTLTKYAAALTLTGALALATAVPSQARHWHNGAAIGAGLVAGALIGAAAANANNNYYGPGYGYYGPGYQAYAYQPAPRRYYNSGDYQEWRCTQSPSSINYAPCYNAP
jgi:hypothetical protein